jgi:hypothetical protein
MREYDPTGQHAQKKQCVNEGVLHISFHIAMAGFRKNMYRFINALHDPFRIGKCKKLSQDFHPGQEKLDTLDDRQFSFVNSDDCDIVCARAFWKFVSVEHCDERS